MRSRLSPFTLPEIVKKMLRQSEGGTLSGATLFCHGTPVLARAKCDYFHPIALKNPGPLRMGNPSIY
jgi:hypothetical protein